MNRAGKGFLQPDDSTLTEIAIPESATGTALHEDRVLVRRDVRRKNYPRTDQETGTVVRILKRNRTQIVGTLQRSRNFFYVIPDDPRIPHDVYVPPPRDVGGPRAWATRWSSNCANGNHATPIPKAKSSKSSARRMGKAWTCFPCCANTICRCISPNLCCTKLTPSVRRFTKKIWPTAWIAARTMSSRLTLTTRRILTTQSAWSACRRSNGGCGFISRTFALR